MLGILGTSVVSCKKSDPVATERCNKYAAAICERFFTCGADDLATNSTLDSSGSDCTPKQPPKPSYFPLRFACYQSVSDCTTREQATLCSDVADTVCDEGEIYHADRANDCVNAWQGLSCDNFSSNYAADTIVCAQICTLPKLDAATP